MACTVSKRSNYARLKGEQAWEEGWVKGQVKMEKHGSWRQSSDLKQGLELGHWGMVGHRGYQLAELLEPGERYEQFDV